MYETNLTVVGNVITDPVLRTTAGGDVASFRMASNVRRKHPDTDEWYNVRTLYLGVSAWGKLATGLMASVEKGRSIIVTGTIHTSEYTAGDGQQRADLEMKASAIGLDLNRCIVKVVGFPVQTLPPVVEVVDPDAPAAEDGGDIGAGDMGAGEIEADDAVATDGVRELTRTSAAPY